MTDDLIAWLRREAYLSNQEEPHEPLTFTVSQMRYLRAMQDRYGRLTPAERALGGDPNWIAFERMYTGWKEAR